MGFWRCGGISSISEETLLAIGLIVRKLAIRYFAYSLFKVEELILDDESQKLFLEG
jgi:hypothetical protein